jgi:trigger factor
VAAKNVDPVALANETVDNALSRAVADVFISENIQVLARPEVEVTKFVPGQELEFTAEADVLPEVKLGNYKKLGVKAEKAEVSEKDVNEILERLQNSMAEKKDVERAAKNGDEVVIDFTGKKDGVAFEGGTAKEYSLELGSNSFIPGFEEGLVGKKAGDSIDLKLAFPESYHVADLAGADVVFETKVHKVRERALPELNDEFAAKTGSEEIKTLKALKADIKRELLSQKEREANEKRKDELVSKLIEVSDVPAPEVLIEDQMRSIEQDMMQNLMYQNVTLENYLSAQKFEDKDEWLEKEVKPAATKRVQAGLVLAKLAKELKVSATDDEIAEHIARYKQSYANSPEMLKRFDEPEVQRDIANRLVTEKTVDELVTLN